MPACYPTTPPRASLGRVLGNLGGTLSSESHFFWHQAGGGSRVDLGLRLLGDQHSYLTHPTPQASHIPAPPVTHTHSGSGASSCPHKDSACIPAALAPWAGAASSSPAQAPGPSLLEAGPPHKSEPHLVPEQAPSRQPALVPSFLAALAVSSRIT